MELAADPRSGGLARRAVDDLAPRLHPETMAKLRLLVTELVVAALDPIAADSLFLTVRIDGGVVRAEVAGRRPMERLERVQSWNLFLVNRIADRWKAGAGGIWFEIEAR